MSHASFNAAPPSKNDAAAAEEEAVVVPPCCCWILLRCSISLRVVVVKERSEGIAPDFVGTP